MEFQVRDVVVGQNFLVSTHYNGMEGEIIGGLAMRIMGTRNGVPCEPHSGMRYRVRWANGDITAQKPQYLRKKKYDGNEIVSWDECIWQPETVKVM